MRRQLAFFAAALLASVSASAAQPVNQATRAPAELTLLGTAGGPGAKPERAGIASLLSVGDHRYLIDAGDGLTGQLARVGIAAEDVRTVFLTHLHDDHTVGLLPLASFGYTRKGSKLELIGPVGTKQLRDGLLATMAPNAEIRMAEQPFLGASSAYLTAVEFGAGEVFKDDAIRVTALENTHFHLPSAIAAHEKAYSLRFDTPDGSIVFTGDTGAMPALAQFARGADILVAEMATSSDMNMVPAALRNHMVHEHLSPAEVGQLARDAGVKTLVLSHIMHVTPADVDEVRRNFPGKVILGTDLLKLPLPVR